ncbi:MAG: sucrose phosphorylase [Chloroflexi bacterium AL-W]|nr:sucrose phosphorylase [Chloroflexi bacterium AL-N1]NOK65394.1 sucrose phosphorylase [Chloroflexi bacterium AL-N10]NOK72340.1 sucrose phosphorylase [Chloroflexi bacterium AL-N5]NOK79573.1 sucrose phosphorylase [Chloroflexi bacterium AL-W]NOK87489.1 sucrose phosphorylase [Chloroflexi bacterium AL-N15]
MKNQVQLIAYEDRLSGGGLVQLHRLIDGPLKGLFGGIHILPFFHPIDGADAGFDPIDHGLVDSRLGSWADIQALSWDIDVMADLIVNHISTKSPQFLDYLIQGDDSRYHGLFLTMASVFPRGSTEADLLRIYRPRPGLPFTPITLRNGQKHILWTTFTAQQVDIDVRRPQGKAYLRSILQTFREGGVSMIRLDAVGYAIKKPGTSCFMIPETFEFIDEIANYAKSLGIEVLAEVHLHFCQQIEIAQRVDRVYDFALPPLILHAFFNQTASYVKQWLAISPRNAITVLDTHDGIGVIDIGADATDPIGRSGLISPEQIDALVKAIHERSGGQSREATGVAASNLDLYQVNCTYYDALGRCDRDYLLARAIQFFAPGIPQVYYVGLLAGENNMHLLEQTHVGRDINRHYYTCDEVEQALNKPVVQDLCRLIRFRKTHPAFNGNFTLQDTEDDLLGMRWDYADEWAQLRIDFRDVTYELSYGNNGQVKDFAVMKHSENATSVPYNV